jgi:hypothetical protein
MSRAPSPPADGYDASADLAASIEFAYRAIRERVARGGPGWGGWPEPASRDRITDSHQEDHHEHRSLR